MKKILSALLGSALVLATGAAFGAADLNGDQDNFGAISAADAAPAQCPRALSFLDVSGLPASSRVGYDSEVLGKSFVGKAIYSNNDDNNWSTLRLLVRAKALHATAAQNDKLTIYRWSAGLPDAMGTTEKVFEADVKTLWNYQDGGSVTPPPWTSALGARTLKVNLKPFLKARYSCFTVVVGNQTSVDYTIVEKERARIGG